MLVPFNALPIWLRTTRIGAWKCSITICGVWSLVSAPPQTAPADAPRMLHDIYRTPSVRITGIPRFAIARRMALQRRGLSAFL